MSTLPPPVLVWASDYPHDDAYPDPVKELLGNIKSMSDEDQAKILGGNAIAAYDM